MKTIIRTALFCIVCSIAYTVSAQTDLVAPVTGTVTGTVENENGELVPPQAAVSGTVVATESNGVVTANVTGTASCTGGLGLHFTFEAQYDTASNSFTGMYSHTPGSAPDQALSFTNDGGYQWTAHLSGEAPSDTGPRSYDLSFQFQIPETAIFSGNQIPAERTYAGALNSTQSVTVPISVPLAGINETLTYTVVFDGSWSAVAVPLVDETFTFTGEASGTFASNETHTISGTIPGFGALSISVGISGSFGGSLFYIDENTVAFQGSWVGSGAGKTFGGDTTITINFQDTSEFPFSVSGTIPIETGFTQMPTMEIPFSVSGTFPLSIQQ